MKHFLLLLLPIFLTSCMVIESDNTINTAGDITYTATVDMSGMITMINSFDSGTTSTLPDSDRDLCIDFEKKSLENASYFTDILCKSLGDYRAEIRSTLTKWVNPGMMTSSGMIVFNPLWSKWMKISAPTSTDMDFGAYGARIVGVFHFPYPIVYSSHGIIRDPYTLEINMLDANILNKREFYIIAKKDNQKPKQSEINKLKMQLRNQIIRIKKTKKYENFQDMFGM